MLIINSHTAWMKVKIVLTVSSTHFQVLVTGREGVFPQQNYSPSILRPDSVPAASHADGCEHQLLLNVVEETLVVLAQQQLPNARVEQRLTRRNLSQSLTRLVFKIFQMDLARFRIQHCKPIPRHPNSAHSGTSLPLQELSIDIRSQLIYACRIELIIKRFLVRYDDILL